MPNEFGTVIFGLGAQRWTLGKCNIYICKAKATNSWYDLRIPRRRRRQKTKKQKRLHFKTRCLPARVRSLNWAEHALKNAIFARDVTGGTHQEPKVSAALYLWGIMQCPEYVLKYNKCSLTRLTVFLVSFGRFLMWIKEEKVGNLVSTGFRF